MAKLKTKKTTMVCMYLTNIICTCWKFFRTRTPFRNVRDFDFDINDLRCQYENELAFQHMDKLNSFFKKNRYVDEDADTVTNYIKVGNMQLKYCFENYMRKNEIPQCCREPISETVKRELIKQTLSSHTPALVVDLEKVKAQKQKREGAHERPGK